LFSAMGGVTEDATGAGAGPGMYTINEDGTRLTRLNTTVADAGAGRGRGGGRGGFGGGGEPQWGRDSRAIYFLQGGGIYTLATAAPATDTGAAAPSGGRGGRGGATPTAAPATRTAAHGAGPT